MLTSYDSHTAKFLSLIPGSLVLIKKPYTSNLIHLFINPHGANDFSATEEKVQLEKGEYVFFNLLIDEPDPLNDNKIQISCQTKDVSYIFRVPIENCDIDELCEKYNDKLFQLYINKLKREELEMYINRERKGNNYE